MSLPIKVAQIRWGEPIGGVESVLRDIALFSNKNNFNYNFIFLSCGGPYESEMRLSGHKVVVIPARNGYDIKMRIALLRELKKYSPDCINEHSVPPLVRPFLKMFLRVPLVSFEHGEILVNHRKGKEWINTLNGFEFRNFSDCVIVNSDMNKNLVAARHRIIHDKIKTVYLGIDLDRFMQNKSSTATDSLVLGYVGRVHNFDKGTDYLPHLAKELIKRGLKKFVFKVIGDGPDRTLIEAQTEKMELRSYFEFLGRRQDIPKLLSGVNILIMPSKTEAFGLAAIEALAAGTRVVAFATGALPEILSGCNDAVLVPEGDVAAMAEAVINNWKINGKERAVEGQEYVKRRFDVKNMVKDIETIYLNTVRASK